jgi:hypothetical protein
LPYNAIFLNLNLLLAFLWQHQQMSMLGLTEDVEITAPCVMHHKSTYTGFGIELWEEIARELELAFS